uniref:Uncharacterized protein n=1 Tax=Rhipicephalus zambeziensis TaxID=60191 RepID=A0A224YG69_9ACAR
MCAFVKSIGALYRGLLISLDPVRGLTQSGMGRGEGDAVDPLSFPELMTSLTACAAVSASVTSPCSYVNVGWRKNKRHEFEPEKHNPSCRTCIQRYSCKTTSSPYETSDMSNISKHVRHIEHIGYIKLWTY